MTPMPPLLTRTSPLFPYSPLVRSRRSAPGGRGARAAVPRQRATLTPQAGEGRMCRAGIASVAENKGFRVRSPVKWVLMDIVLANPRGFCAGVDRAIEIVKRAIETLGAPIYGRHEVVHDRYVEIGRASGRG